MCARSSLAFSVFFLASLCLHAAEFLCRRPARPPAAAITPSMASSTARSAGVEGPRMITPGTESFTCATTAARATTQLYAAATTPWTFIPWTVRWSLGFGGAGYALRKLFDGTMRSENVDGNLREPRALYRWYCVTGKNTLGSLLLRFASVRTLAVSGEPAPATAVTPTLYASTF